MPGPGSGSPGRWPVPSLTRTGQLFGVWFSETGGQVAGRSSVRVRQPFRKTVLVQDNLSARTDAVFYQHLTAAEARVPAARYRGALPAQNRLLAQHGRTQTLRHCPSVPAPAHSHPTRTHRPRNRPRDPAQSRPRHRPLAFYPRKGPHQTRPTLPKNQGNQLPWLSTRCTSFTSS